MTLRNHLIVSFDSFIFSFENDHDIHNMKIGRAYDFVNPRPFSSFDYYNDIFYFDYILKNLKNRDFTFVKLFNNL